jgi:hypothetical protein
MKVERKRIRDLIQKLDEATTPGEVARLTEALVAAQIAEGPRDARDIINTIESVVLQIKKEGKEEQEHWVERLGSAVRGIELLSTERNQAIQDRKDCEKGIKTAITHLSSGRTNAGMLILTRLAWTDKEQREAYSIKKCVMCGVTSADVNVNITKTGSTWLCSQCRAGGDEQ